MSTGIGSGSSHGSQRDGAHLDEDAECLEDPVHCGDARHQHDAHATSTAAPPAAVQDGPQAIGEASQA
jgi:hypothetical protein